MGKSPVLTVDAQLLTLANMRQLPGMGQRTWFKHNSMLPRPWDGDAECRLYKDLPWVADGMPGQLDLNQMNSICAGCSVRMACAKDALQCNNGSGVDGGFYAGVWVPWKSDTESDRARYNRTTARRHLKHAAGLASVSSQ